MTREEALKKWQEIWVEQVGKAYKSTDEDFWYVNGYICWIQNGSEFPGHVDVHFREIWLQGNRDAKGDWP